MSDLVRDPPLRRLRRRMVNGNSDKPRLAVLFNSFWVNSVGMSGGDKRLIEIFRRIGNRFRIDIYTSEAGARTICPILKTAESFCAPKTVSRESFYTAYPVRTVWAARRILQREYDLLYSSSDFFPDVTPCFVYKGRHPRCKWVQCIFHVYPKSGLRRGSKLRNMAGAFCQKLSFAMARKRADHLINLNTQVKEELISRGFSPQSISVNPCGVDLDYLRGLDADVDPMVACFIGRLAPTKGIYDLLAIWKLVVARSPSARLKIIGNGPRKIEDNLRASLKSASLESSVELCGYLPDHETFRALKSSKVFLMPSHEEGFCIAIAEALACGVPVVAWDLPVYSDVFSFGGLVSVRENDIDRFADTVLKVLSNDLHVETATRDELARYSWDGIAEHELAILDGLLNAKQCQSAIGIATQDPG